MKFIYLVCAFLGFENAHCITGSIDQKQIIVAITQEWGTLHPTMIDAYPAEKIAPAVFEPVIRYTDKNEFQSNLLSGPPKINKNKSTIEWKISSHARWADNVPITCADFELARLVTIQKNLPALTQKMMLNFSEIKTQKNNICISKLEKINFGVEEIIPRPIPAHLEKDIFDLFLKGKGNYQTDSNYVKNPTMPGLYSGPYRIKEINFGKDISLIRNENYFGHKAKTENIIFKLIPSTQALLVQLQSGGVHLAMDELGLTLEQALRLAKNNPQKLQIFFNKEDSVERLTFDVTSGPTSDSRFRSALQMGLDIDLFLKTFFDSKVKRAVNFMLEEDFLFDQRDNFAEFNRPAANKILDEKYPRGDDGFRKYKGQTIELVLTTTAGNASRENLEQFFTDQLKKLGIKSVVKNFPARVLFGDLLKCQPYQGLVISAIGNPIGQISSRIYHSNPESNKKSDCIRTNISFWKNTKADSALEKLDVETDVKKRKALVRLFLKEFNTDVPHLILYYQTTNIVAQPNLKGSFNVGLKKRLIDNIATWELL